MPRESPRIYIDRTDKKGGSFKVNKYMPEGRLWNTPANLAAMRSPAALAEAKREGRILEARAAVCDSSHNLLVDLGCMTGVIPREEGAVGLREGTVRDIALISRVNKPVCFFITDFSTEGGRPVAILSRRAVQEKCQREYLERLIPGDVIDGRVTHFEPFGAFVDIGCGIPSLIPIDTISVSRISHPSDRFRIGEDIRAVVRGIDCSGRISLSHKELLGTWKENAERFHVGETVSGIVRSVENYGVFIELSPNLAGLAEPREGVEAGSQASVYIKNILEDKMKVKLIIIDTFGKDQQPQPLEYFCREDHLDRWVYSPDSCSRVIETLFCERPDEIPA